MLRIACRTPTSRPHVAALVVTLLLAFTAVNAAPTRGQVVPLPVGPTDSATIALIEADAATHPRPKHVPPYPEDHLAGWKAFPERFGPLPEEIGSAERRCVAVPPAGVMEHRFDRIWVPTAYMRSGEFQMSGGWPMVHGKGQKLPWTPALPAPGMELLLRARHLSGSGETFHVTVTDFIYDPSRSPNLPWEKSFPTGVVFPSPGTWVVVGTAGPNWGCLLYTVG